MFGIQTLFVKFFSCATAVGSGLPVGPEGPMVHIGALLGGALSQGQSTSLQCSTGGCLTASDRAHHDWHLAKKWLHCMMFNDVLCTAAATCCVYVYM